MKKFLLLAMCMVAIAVNAQEKKGGFAVELGIGTVHFGNFSPVSAFADPTDSYGLVASEHISAGYYGNSGWFMGLTLGSDGGSTSFQNYNESFTNINVMFDTRRCFKLNDRLELETGAAIGLLFHNNTFDYMGGHYSLARYGASCHFSLGLNYMIRAGQYFGLRATYPCYGSFIDEKPLLPTGLVATGKSQFIGFGLQVNYGMRF